MNTTQQIKIIKLADREKQAQEKAEQSLALANQAEQEKTLDAATTVKGWIGESRLQKQQNTDAVLRSFKSLFEEAK